MRAARPAAPDPRFTAFLAAVLAPLPAGAEPASTPSFRRQAQADANDAWHKRWLIAEATWHGYKAMSYARCREFDLGTELAEEVAPLERSAWADFVRAVHQLMLWPAPKRQALTWKLKHRCIDGGRDAWEAAINADEDRLGLPRTTWRGGVRPWGNG